MIIFLKGLLVVVLLLILCSVPILIVSMFEFIWSRIKKINKYTKIFCEFIEELFIILLTIGVGIALLLSIYDIGLKL